MKHQQRNGVGNEKRIQNLVAYTIKQGLYISVFDGEEWAIKMSNNKKGIIEAIESVEEANITIRDSDRKFIASAYIIPFGVSPDETVADYSDNEYMQKWSAEFYV